MKMDCNEFKNSVADLFDKDTDPQMKARCKRHMAECAECRQYYEELSAVADKLRPHHYPTSNFHRPTFHKTAATFIGILFVTGMAVAAVHIWTHSADSSSKNEEGSVIQATDTARHSVPLPMVKEAESEADTIVFDNVPLEKMLTQIAGYHHKEVEFVNAEARQLRFFFVWKQDEELDATLHRLDIFENITVKLKDNKIVVE